jgi:hypothetical protein
MLCRLTEYKNYRTAAKSNTQPQMDAFVKLCDWLENGSEVHLYSVKELHNKMQVFGDNTYSEKHFRSKLKERYGDHVFFAQKGGSREDAVCFRNMAEFIINDRWFEEKSFDSKEESTRFIVAAAKLIRELIRAMNYSKTVYPGLASISDLEISRNFLCPGLRAFLDIS